MVEAIKLKVLDDNTIYENILIGNSKFTDDIWDMTPFMPRKTLAKTDKKIRFGYIENAAMRWTVKLYAYHRLSRITPFSVHHEINGVLPVFFEYCKLNTIVSFADITKDIFLDYSYWLKDCKKYRESSGFKRLRILEEIIRVGQVKGWEVPSDNLFLQISTKDLWNPRNDRKKNKFKPIPEEIFDRILNHAIHDENDVLTKAGIIIQSQTGLRINEVLSIKEGCIHCTDGEHHYMEVSLSKTVKGEAIIHKVFVNHLVVEAVKELSEATKGMRQESGLQELFLTRSQPFHNRVVVYKVGLFATVKITQFIKRWDIRNKEGELYPLTSHQFRATYVRELVKRNIPIAFVMKQYGHVSIEMTSHYLTLQEEEVKAIYSELLLAPGAKLAGLRAAEIRNKLDLQFKGKTESEVEEIITKLSKTMSYNPLPNGVCLYDFRRGNCTDGDGCFFYNCPNYVTETSFYPVLQKELELMEKEMVRLKELGQERDWQRQYVKYQYLKPLVDSLEEQMYD